MDVSGTGSFLSLGVLFFGAEGLKSHGKNNQLLVHPSGGLFCNVFIEKAEKFIISCVLSDVFESFLYALKKL